VSICAQARRLPALTTFQSRDSSRCKLKNMRYGTSRDLFTNVGNSSAPPHYLIAHTDGGARGNPGPAGYGVVIQDESGKKVGQLSEYLGRQTNNFAEYQALIAALEYALRHGPKALKVISDSELLVLQIKGVYKVKNPTLQDLHARAKELIAKLEWFSIGHALREHNQEADRLANYAMDKGMGRVARTPAPSNVDGSKDGSLSSGSQGNQDTHTSQEFEGVVRNGRIELLSGELPEGARVQVRVKPADH
jgi:ribonuclease HI